MSKKTVKGYESISTKADKISPTSSRSLDQVFDAVPAFPGTFAGTVGRRREIAASDNKDGVTALAELVKRRL